MKKMIAARRIAQIFFLLLFIYVLWSTTYPLTGVIQPGILFKLDPLLMIVTSISERIILPGIVFSAAMIFLALIFGRFFCGWICPLGTVIDIAHAARRKETGLSDRSNLVIRKIKFFVLGLFFISALFGFQIAWTMDPIAIMGRFVSLNLIPSVTSFFNSVFMVIIKDLGFGGWVKDLYHYLKPMVLGVKVFNFSHASVILSFFLIICISAVFMERSWCRALCPLGALYSLFARFAILRRITGECSACSLCKSHCRMGAIRDDLTYAKGECILCMDCIYNCPDRVTKFKFSLSGSVPKIPPQKDETRRPVLSRKNFLLMCIGSFSLFTVAFRRRRAVLGASVIRPPAALEEDDFTNRCVRCGNCMKVCPTNAIHPSMLQGGIQGLWTPQIIPEIGYCEYQCTLCGHTCPTGALPALSLEEKKKTKLGIAVVDRSICLPWAEGKECLVCQEHCPVPDKAIKLDTYSGGPARPYVDEYLCVGCGICQNKCPVRPMRAIRVNGNGADRTAV